jgi:hypothetical protein
MTGLFSSSQKADIRPWQDKLHPQIGRFYVDIFLGKLESSPNGEMPDSDAGRLDHNLVRYH